MARSKQSSRSCASGPSSGQRTDTSAPCDLCGRLGRAGPAKRRHAASGTGHGLQIALVDDDEDTRLAARGMTRAQGDGWSLETCHPCCLAAEASAAEGVPRPSGLSWTPHTGVAADVSRRRVRCQRNAPTDVGGYAPPANRAKCETVGLRGNESPRSRPDIVLVGVSSRDASRLACVRRIKALAADLPVLIISGRCDGRAIAQYCMTGADGWLIRPLVPGELARAVRAAAHGEPALCREAEKALMDFLHRAGATLSSHGLTHREREIVGCLAENLSNKEIAVRLGVSTDTVHVHLGHLFQKLGVHRRGQAVSKVLGGEE